MERQTTREQIFLLLVMAESTDQHKLTFVAVHCHKQIAHGQMQRTVDLNFQKTNSILTMPRATRRVNERERGRALVEVFFQNQQTLHLTFCKASRKDNHVGEYLLVVGPCFCSLMHQMNRVQDNIHSFLFLPHCSI